MASASAQDTFDPKYLKLFSQRSKVALKKKQYWVFEPSDLGGYIGCYRWGCYLDGEELLGKRIVLIARIQAPEKVSSTSNLFAIAPETHLGLISGGLTGHPPALANASPDIARQIKEGIQNKNCGETWSLCSCVIWGTVKYSSESTHIPWTRSSSYYYLDVSGINIFGRYDLLSAAKEGATLGWSQALSMMNESGFKK